MSIGIWIYLAVVALVTASPVQSARNAPARASRSPIDSMMEPMVKSVSDMSSGFLAPVVKSVSEVNEAVVSPVMKSVSEVNEAVVSPMMKSVSGIDMSDNPVMSFIGFTTVRPPVMTTRAPKRKIISSPIEKIGESVTKITTNILPKPFREPMESVAKLPLVSGATKTLTDATQMTGKFFGQLTGLTSMSPLEGDKAYYEYNYDDEPNKYREPRYFSRECRFRSACEIGRQMRQYMLPFAGIVARNAAIQDLQNRYTRAVTYGLLHDDCDRYYCLLTQFVSGPKNFVGGVAELLNRVANPDLYSSI